MSDELPSTHPCTVHAGRQLPRRFSLFVLLLATTVAAWVWWWPRNPPEPVLESPRRFDETMPDAPEPYPNPGYVGASVCAECHAARHQEFCQTRHYRACWTPEQGPMPAGFTGERASYTSATPGIRFTFTQSGRDYFQTIIRDGPQGSLRQSRRIDLIYGSGGVADEVFFSWDGDRLRELPMAWLHPTEQWGEQPFNPLAPGDFSRTTTVRCVECHNTWVAHVPGTENQYRRTEMHLGVTCEKCHGPGRDHVQYHRDNPGVVAGHAIVHPGQLSRERQMEVCAQCHSNAMRNRSPAFSYRPGEPLDHYYRTLNIQDREHDHVADQTRYLKQSKCFQASDNLTCVTCHNPHRPSDVAKVRGACMKCHEANDCREQPRLPPEVRTDCVSCHMPRYNRIAVRFNTADDKYLFPMRPHEHRIAIYPEARQEVLYHWYRKQTDSASQDKARELGEWLANYWITESERLVKQHLFVQSIGAAREAVRLHPSAASHQRLQDAVALQSQLDRLAHLADSQISGRNEREAIRTLEEGLKLNPRAARFHEKLGMLYARTGQRDRAIEHWRLTAQADPDNADCYHLWGQLAFQEGRYLEAAELFRQADEISPFTAEANYRWGLALLRLERWDEAAQRFRQAMVVNPNHAGSAHSLAHALLMTGDGEEAVRLAHHAARLTGFHNIDVLMTFGSALANVNRTRDALEILERAKTEAQLTQSELVGPLTQRISELRHTRSP
jgi:tetratricopeptide (TPR) repeat protein